MSYEEIRASFVKARSSYACSWCGQEIEKGERHVSRAYKFDGEFCADRMHVECLRAMERAPFDEIGSGWVFGSMVRGEYRDKWDAKEVSK